MSKRSPNSFLLPLLLFLITTLPNLYRSVINRNPKEPIVYSIKTGESSNELLSRYNWSFTQSNLQKTVIDLSIYIDEIALERVLQTYIDMGSKTYEEMNITTYYEDDPDLFQQQKWGSIYSYLNSHASPELDIVADGFINITRNEEFSDGELLQMIISFVQSIEYQIPENEFGLLAPLQSINYRYADCDSAALLLYSILDRVGFRVGIYYSRHYLHAMLGINTSATGHYKKHKGLRYYFLETTNKGWRIGQLPSEMTDTEKWAFIDLKERLPL